MNNATPTLPLPALMLVTDRALCPLDRLPGVVDAAVGAGVNLVQVREKDLGHDDLVHIVRTLRDVTRGRALLLVNGSVAAALAGGADGVQLGDAAMPVTEARALAAGRLLLGRSVHHPEGARAAVAAGADFLVLGTIYPSRSHPGGAAAGPALVATVSRAVSVPVIGIGGITAANARDVIGAGAAGVAVISAILGAPHPAAATAGLHHALAAAWRARAGDRATVTAHAEGSRQ